ARRSHLGKPDPRRADGAPESHELRHLLRGLESFEPFLPDSFGRELSEALRIRLRCLQRPDMDPELEARAEPQRSQNAQIVFLKPPVGITDGTDQLLLEILLALEGVTPLMPDRVI